MTDGAQNAASEIHRVEFDHQTITKTTDKAHNNTTNKSSKNNNPAKNNNYTKSPAQLANPDKVFDSNCTIHYKNISCKLSLPKNPNEVSNNFTPLVKLGKAIATCGDSCQSSDFYRVKDASGVIRPGTMTLVLSGAGQGKSSFLRLLSNRIPLTSGQVTYNGRNFEEAEEEGCDLRKMTQYVDQVDTHLVCSRFICFLHFPLFLIHFVFAHCIGIIFTTTPISSRLLHFIHSFSLRFIKRPL
jgi:ABC-type multidrug transport system fused ATPase/permease subunit